MSVGMYYVDSVSHSITSKSKKGDLMEMSKTYPKAKEGQFPHMHVGFFVAVSHRFFIMSRSIWYTNVAWSMSTRFENSVRICLTILNTNDNWKTVKCQGILHVFLILSPSIDRKQFAFIRKCLFEYFIAFARTKQIIYTWKIH